MKLLIKIIKESILITLAASIFSAVGGIGLQSVEVKLSLLIPFIILFPALNDTAGDFGAIISSKFTTLLYTKKINKKWWTSKTLGLLFAQVLAVAFISALYLALISTGIAKLQGFVIQNNFVLKMIAISSISIFILVCLITIISITVGLYVYKKKHDPDNYLIPLATSVADLCSMLIYSSLIRIFF